MRLLDQRRTAPIKRAKVGGPLDDIDDEFHASYAQSRYDVSTEATTWVVMADELVCFDAGQRTAYEYTPRAYQVIKKVSHVPLAIFSASRASRAAEVEEHLGRRQQLAAWVRAARASLEQEVLLDEDTKADLYAVLDDSDAYLRASQSTVDAERADGLARGLGPVMLRLIARATELQLRALHACTEQALAALSPAAKRRLQVVITGNHQARARSLPMQYFKSRFREPANLELRVTYAEGVSSEADALALVGTRELDRAIGRAFFCDDKRMQRDLLGDAAHEVLQRWSLEPIV